MIASQDELIITVQTAAPEELRQCLLRAINAAMLWYVHCPDGMKTDDHKEDITALLELQKSLLQ